MFLVWSRPSLDVPKLPGADGPLPALTVASDNPAFSLGPGPRLGLYQRLTPSIPSFAASEEALLSGLLTDPPSPCGPGHGIKGSSHLWAGSPSSHVVRTPGLCFARPSKTSLG